MSMTTTKFIEYRDLEDLARKVDEFKTDYLTELAASITPDEAVSLRGTVSAMVVLPSPHRGALVSLSGGPRHY
jgi:hypothetical protein